MSPHAQHPIIRQTRKQAGVALLAITELVALATGPSGCAGVRGRPDPAGEVIGEAGNLCFALTGVSATGVTYRLRNALFAVSGPTTRTASSEDAPEAAAIRLELAVGEYEATLTSWILEKKAADGSFAPVRARLRSPNPARFSVTRDHTTTVVFSFDADGDVIRLEQGSVDIRVAVDTCDGECAPGVLTPASVDGGAPEAGAPIGDPNPMDALMGLAFTEMPRDGVLERTGETALGDLVADAFRSVFSTQLGLIAGGGLRSPLPSAYIPTTQVPFRPGSGGNGPFNLVAGDAYAVLPFHNHVVIRTITGQQLWLALEHGVSLMPAAASFFPQISGFHFTYSVVAPKVRDIHLEDGTPVLADQTPYTLALDGFLAGGGDGYTVFADGQQGATGGDTADVLRGYIRQQGGILPRTVFDRITAVP